MRIVSISQADDDSPGLPIIAPGLVDLQVNGYGGQEFNDLELTVEKVEQVSRALDRDGVTSYLPTSTQPGPDPDSIVQRVEIRYANKHTAVERTLVDRQVWKWYPEEERWWLMSGLPDITRR